MSPPQQLWLLCAGAAQGLVGSLQAGFEAATGAKLQARFGAVGAMREALRGGEACDVMLVTERMVAELVAEAALRPTPRGLLGRVRTGVAVRRGDAAPDITTPDTLRAALLAASAVYFPDPVRATAGIHFAQVIEALGVGDVLRERLRPHPNGATAMRELAAGPAGAIGCTQISEILCTDGVALAGPLPPRFELATPYTAAVASAAASPALAEAFIALLCGESAAAARHATGFEV